MEVQPTIVWSQPKSLGFSFKLKGFFFVRESQTNKLPPENGKNKKIWTHFFFGEKAEGRRGESFPSGFNHPGSIKNPKSSYPELRTTMLLCLH